MTEECPSYSQPGSRAKGFRIKTLIICGLTTGPIGPSIADPCFIDAGAFSSYVLLDDPCQADKEAHDASFLRSVLAIAGGPRNPTARHLSLQQRIDSRIRCLWWFALWKGRRRTKADGRFSFNLDSCFRA